MSGTEAVMQAVRLARYHTGGGRISCASAAPITAGGATCSRVSAIRSRHGRRYTLAEMSEATLNVLRRRRDIACVLVNPIQALHPNEGPPGDFGADRQLAPCRVRSRRLR